MAQLVFGGKGTHAFHEGWSVHPLHFPVAAKPAKPDKGHTVRNHKGSFVEDATELGVTIGLDEAVDARGAGVRRPIVRGRPSHLDQGGSGRLEWSNGYIHAEYANRWPLAATNHR